MDQKFRDGDPLSGKPMKRFGEDDDVSSLPAPPAIDELVAAVEAEKPLTKEQARKLWRCPCGETVDSCRGNFFFSAEQMFEAAFEAGEIKR